MNIALVTDCISEKTLNLMDCISELHELCVFLPESDKPVDMEYKIRTYTPDFDTAAFQRYDAVVFMADENWNLLLPFIKTVKGAAVISPDNENYSEISRCTEYIISDSSQINDLLASMPEHILWFDRSDKEILGRVNEMGLMTPEFLKTYKKVFFNDKEISQNESN